MKRLSFLLGALCIAAAVFLAAFVPAAWFSRPAQDAPIVKFEIPQGAIARDVASLLNSDGLIYWKTGYLLYARIDASARRPKAGMYRIKPGMSYRAMARTFAIGPERSEIALTVIEGWDLIDMEKALVSRGADTAAFRELVGDPFTDKPFDPALRADYPFLAALGKKATLEGYLFPNTYRVYEDQLPQALVKKQLDEFAKRAPGITEEAKKQGRTLEEVVILASIVEKEVARSEDRKIVAGIFLRRIAEGMPLQSDATVNYVTRAGRARPTLKDLEADSPLNTYRNKGLPPAPISNPGDDALMAALRPAETPYRFFLTDEQGKTYYAKNFDEHQRNRQRVFGD